MTRKLFLLLAVTVFALTSCASTQHPDDARARGLSEDLLTLQKTCHGRWQDAMITEIGEGEPLSLQKMDEFDLIVYDCFEPKQPEILEQIRNLYCPHLTYKEICEGWKAKELPPGKETPND